MPLNDLNKTLWLWLLQQGGYWTAGELAVRTGYDAQLIFRGLTAMARRGLMVKQRTEWSKNISYGVDGTCLVPKGMRLAEVQE